MPRISLSRQAELLGISRSSIYYKPIIDPEEIRLMGLIDEIYTKYPFYGSRRIQYELWKRHEVAICRQYVQGLMRKMGLEAIYPKPRGLSGAVQEHLKYPYLLRELAIIRPDQVWGTDITYVRLENGFAYLVALLDWFSRYVVAWQLSETLEINFCLENLEEALRNKSPEIHNSDQGSHFTSPQYIEKLAGQDIRISMDGRGRCMDNIFTERLWRTVKYENIYIKSYGNFKEAKLGLSEFFPFYNEVRPHQSLGNKTPAEVYFGK